jgi:hypothetical protein
VDPATFLPPFMTAERDALLMDIETTFGGVTRVGGVSWSESAVADRYGSAEEFEQAKLKDRDRRWQDLVDDPNWESSPGIGGWSFLDPIAFRYYLPAAMVRSIRFGYDVGVLFHLHLSSPDLIEDTREKWSELDLPQRHCVRRYLEYMFVASRLHVNTAWSKEDEWMEASEFWPDPSRTGEAAVEATRLKRQKKR